MATPAVDPVATPPTEVTPATPVKLPIAIPAPESTPAAPVALTPDQQAKYDELLAAARSWETLPTTAKGAESAPLDDDEKLWLTRECLLRYVRATKWNLAQATKRLQDTMVWRREYGTAGFTADYISPENEKGKQVILGFDNEGRPCLYLLPQNQNTKVGPRQLHHLVYMLERTLDIAPPGQETLALLIDFRNSSAGSQPSIGTGKQALSILQNHYPERLGRALITHLPWYVTAFLKLISPFIDPVTKTKMRYNEPLTQHVPAHHLMKDAGGSVDFQYDHSVYWPALAELADERRAARKERWHAAGKLVGESEVYLWGGDEKSVGAAQEAKSEPAVQNTDAAQEVKTEPVPASETVQEAKTEPAQNGSASQENGVAADLAKLDVKDDDKITKVAA